MPRKCGVVNCKGNYNKTNKCRVFRLPRDESERNTWLEVIPPRENFDLIATKFFICERHWPQDAPMIKLPGGSTRPSCPPSIFNVPSSCLPTPKPAPRPPKQEDRQLDFFMKKDKIKSFDYFDPTKELHKKYHNIMVSKSNAEFVCVFMSQEYKESYLSIVVHNKSTLCSPLTLSAYKNGINVPLGKILNPNNGLSSYSQFFEAINCSLNYDPLLDGLLDKVATLLQSSSKDLLDANKAKKLTFIIRQLQLLTHKEYSTTDFCFAIESFPKCSYEQLREVLVLPSKRKLQSIISATDIDQVLEKTFRKLDEKQKNAFLIIDEVKIRPSISFSGGVLSGMARNNPDSKATSMLCVMLRCLHGGPSVMVSVHPVHKLNAEYQFNVVKDVAATVEKAGGVIIGSITDNHKINQQFCKLFHRVSDYKAIHPLDEKRVWFLLFDTVHLLKCIRNNWITEKCQQLTIDNENVGVFDDVKNLYQSEKGNVLKSTPLTQTAVSPSRLQLQNVQHVLRVFNEKVVAALRLKGAVETANFIQLVLDWWNIVNVSGKGQEIRMRDPNRSVQDQNSTNLQVFLEKFKASNSGHGAGRVQSLTHDTKKAIVQTIEGLIAVCQHLFTVGFEYVLLREIQSDRIEGEFSVYRQSTGANAFMDASNVFAAFKKRLTRFAASFLQSVDQEQPLVQTHSCEAEISFEDASSIEHCISDVTLSSMEESAVAYVAGWLEAKCGDDLNFDDEEPLLMNEAKDFIEGVSRGCLTVPHMSTYELVRTGLCFVKKNKHRACCRQKLVNVLSIIDSFYDLRLTSKGLYRRLANVLLHGLQNLDKDQDKNVALYQTSIKKARLAD